MNQNILLFGLILLVNLSLKSQTYVPFPTEKVNWSVFNAGTTCSETVRLQINLNSGIYSALIIDKNGKILISKKILKE